MHTVFSIWMQYRSIVPPHLKSYIDNLSITHSSGIRLEQLDSPMMKQFKSAKDEVPDALLFFRMGDFFELFGLDAIIASDICDLTLTSRDKSHANPVPMAGVPVVNYKNTLKKCLEAGFKVAVCDQVEDPRLAKGIVKREITRIATPAIPGDLEDDDNPQKNIAGCYLASVIYTGKNFTFAYIDCSTGEFRLTSNLEAADVKQEILTIKPKEILVEGNLEKKLSAFLQNESSHFEMSSRGSAMSSRSDFHRDKLLTAGTSNHVLLNKIEPWLVKSEKICKELFLEFFDERAFHNFGLSTIDGALACVASILLYLKTTQRNIFKNIRPIDYYVASDHLLLDDSTRRNLDLFVTSTGDKKGSLLGFLNECQTSMGSRMLMRRMNYPFKSVQDIQAAHNAVSELYNEHILSLELQNLLSHCYDIEKILSRAMQKSFDVKSAVLLKSSLNLIPKMINFFDTNHQMLPVLYRYTQNHTLHTIFPLIEFLNHALNDEPLNQLGSGSRVFIKNYSKELDEICDLEQNFQQKLDELENFERTRSNIPTLKIGYTRVFGYYFEVSRGKLGQVPKHFERKQTLTNAERFITPELKELEEKALSAAERRFTLERELFEHLRLKIVEYSKELLNSATFFAYIDLTLNFAHLAQKYGWVQPTVLETPETQLIDCYHPVMKYFSSAQEDFIPNTVEFGAQKNRIHLITGPNMAGKSTLMRQVAINQLLCQMGSFVCAKTARIGVADRILSRIGSADHSTKNQSTFMVEMLETAHILKMATSRSLILMDEVGRGTSTYDGMSIAWAILEDIHDTSCPRTLFSTHYHELVQVCAHKDAIVPMQMGVLVQNTQDAHGNIVENLIFSRQYVSGFIGQSFGLNVAMLAGIPTRIIERAKQILKPLEQKQLIL